MRKALSSRNTQLHSFKPNSLVPRRRGVPQLRLFQFDRNIDASQRFSHSLKAVGTDTGRDPEDVRGAIAVGLQLYEDKNYQEALKVFEKALNLPGTGLKRFRYCIGQIKRHSLPGISYLSKAVAQFPCPLFFISAYCCGLCTVFCYKKSRFPLAFLESSNESLRTL